MALLCGLAALKLPGEGRLIAAHVNHKLRGADSDADQALCRTALPAVGAGVRSCDGRGRSYCRQSRPGDRGHRATCSLCRAGRDGRAGGGTLCRHRAHGRRSGRDDPASHSPRHGPPRPRRHVAHAAARPGDAPAAAVGLRRAELAAYLRDRQQPFRTDASNRDVRFMRNRIRNELLPLLAARYNPTIIDALLRLGELAGESQALIDAMVRDVARRAWPRRGTKCVWI